MHKKVHFALIFSIVGLVLLSSCTSSEQYRTLSGTTWGTIYNITYRSDRDLSDSIRAVMEQVDCSLSPFNEASTISRINRGETAQADSMFAAVFQCAQQVAALSGGRFDPTVAPLVNLWGFGYKKGTTDAPTDSAINAVLSTVGIADCSLDRATGRVTKKCEATEFDFSAIAKGYGCDAVAAMLRRNGVTDYMVEIGGEIVLSGVNSHGEEWRIQVDAPIESSDSIVSQGAMVMSLSDCGVASSGNYRNYRDTSQGRVGHTISPLTGRPVGGELLAVTIIAPDAMMADALATACMAMPMSEGRAMIDTLEGVEALFITTDAAGEYVLTTTAAFPAAK